MKLRKIHFLLLIPSLALILLLINANVESGIMWGLIYILLLPVYTLISIILICIDKYRTDGLHLLLGVGILALVGFSICSSGFL